jgi:hypothetical protein
MIHCLYIIHNWNKYNILQELEKMKNEKKKEITIQWSILKLQVNIHLDTWAWWSSCPFDQFDPCTQTQRKQVMPSGIATWQVRNQMKLERIWPKLPSWSTLSQEPSHIPSTCTHTASLLTRLCACPTAHTGQWVTTSLPGQAVDQEGNEREV